MTEEVKKRVKIIDGPALFKGIICDRWIFAPKDGRQRLPLFFTAEGGKKFHVWIHAFLLVPGNMSAHNEMAVLLGKTSDKDICPSEHFAMLYTEHKTGELEPIGPFTCPYPLILESCGVSSFFRAPIKEAKPLTDYLLALPREEKFRMATGFLAKVFEEDTDALLTNWVWMSLINRSRDWSEQVHLEVKLGDNKLGRKIFWNLDNVCKKFNQFLRDLGLSDYVGCGIAIGGIGNLYFSLDGVNGRGEFTKHEIPLDEIITNLSPAEKRAYAVEPAPAGVDRKKLIAVLSREQKMQVLVNQILMMGKDENLLPVKLKKLLLALLEESDMLERKSCLRCPNALLTDMQINRCQVFVATLNQTLDELSLDDGLAIDTDLDNIYLYNYTGPYDPIKRRANENQHISAEFLNTFETKLKMS